MLKYTVKRLLMAIPTLLIVLAIVFFAVRLIPGDLALIMLGDDATQEQQEAWRESHGLNKSVPEQFLIFAKNALRGDFGESMITGQPVTKTIAMYMEPTLVLVLMATIITVLIGIPVGIIAAVKRGSVLDTTIMTASMVGLATPAFWLGLMLCLWFAVELKWLPASGYKNIDQNGLWTALRYMVLPSLAIATQRIATVARFTRSCMLDVVHADYVRTARAKGVKEWRITLKHMLRTTMSPVVTTIGLGIAQQFGGAIVTEQIFNIPGIGLLAYNSIVQRDLPVIQAIVVYVAMVYIAINLILDVLYKFFDPRVELE